MNQQSALQKLIEGRGHLCMFTPKFHPELAWIELYWAKAKRWTRGRLDRSWAGLKKAMWVAMGRKGGGGAGSSSSSSSSSSSNNISSLHRQRFARKARDYVRAYAAGATVGTVDALRKLLKDCRQFYSYRQHRAARTGGGILD